MPATPFKRCGTGLLNSEPIFPAPRTVSPEDRILQGRIDRRHRTNKRMVAPDRRRRLVHDTIRGILKDAGIPPCRMVHILDNEGRDSVQIWTMLALSPTGEERVRDAVEGAFEEPLRKLEFCVGEPTILQWDEDKDGDLRRERPRRICGKRFGREWLDEETDEYALAAGRSVKMPFEDSSSSTLDDI